MTSFIKNGLRAKNRAGGRGSAQVVVPAAVARAARSCVEALEARQLMHAGHDHNAKPSDAATEVDAAPPTATLSVENVTTAGGTTHSVRVRYADVGGALDPTTIALEDLVITARRGRR
jgi:hypothetical protein